MAKELPPVVMSDIFCRLPVKSLLRFTCLSKHYCSEILSPDFIKRHHTQSLKSNTNHSLLITEIGVDSLMPDMLLQALSLPPSLSNITSLKFDSIDDPVTLRNPLEKSKLVGSFNGLLCLHSYDGRVALFNFATRKHRILPSVHFDLVHTDYCIYGFGYDESKDDYVVARIVRKQRSPGTEVMLYSLKANSWRKVTKDIPFAPYDRRMGVYAYGKIHFELADLEDNRVIVAFDPDFDSYQLVPIPDIFAWAKSSLVLSLLGGCLCLCPQGSSVWVMKNYGVKESWTNIITFSGELAREFLCPVAYSLKGDKMLFQATYGAFYWYDLANKGMEKIKMSISLPQMSVGVVIVDTLVSLKSKKKVLQTEAKKPEEAKDHKKDTTKKGDAYMSWMKLAL